MKVPPIVFLSSLFFFTSFSTISIQPDCTPNSIEILCGQDTIDVSGLTLIQEGCVMPLPSVFDWEVTLQNSSGTVVELITGKHFNGNNHGLNRLVAVVVSFDCCEVSECTPEELVISLMDESTFKWSPGCYETPPFPAVVDLCVCPSETPLPNLILTQNQSGCASPFVNLEVSGLSFDDGTLPQIWIQEPGNFWGNIYEVNTGVDLNTSGSFDILEPDPDVLSLLVTIIEEFQCGVEYNVLLKYMLCGEWHTVEGSFNLPCAPEPCTPITNLTACEEEGNYGFIALDCYAKFEWTFPGGSPSIGFTSPQHSVITQASEGIYSVLVTYPGGCTEELSFEIVSDCCYSSPCPAPTNLTCIDIEDAPYLTWSEVPNASYQITINSGNSSGCPGCEGEDEQFIFTSNDYQFMLPEYLANACFSWSVQAICNENVQSEPSSTICYDGSLDCVQHPPGNREGSIPVEVGIKESIKIHPNPTVGDFSIDGLEQIDGSVTVKVYDLNGKNIWSETVSRKESQISLSELGNLKGLFIVRIFSKSELLSAKKIVIQ